MKRGWPLLLLLPAAALLIVALEVMREPIGPPPPEEDTPDRLPVAAGTASPEPEVPTPGPRRPLPPVPPAFGDLAHLLLRGMVDPALLAELTREPGTAAPYLERLRTAADPLERAMALLVLLASENPEARPGVFSAARGEFGDLLSVTALLGLSRDATPEALDLLESVAEGSGGEAARDAAIVSLARNDPERAVPILLRGLRGSDSRGSRELLYSLLGNMPPPVRLGEVQLPQQVDAQIMPFVRMQHVLFWPMEKEEQALILDTLAREEDPELQGLANRALCVIPDEAVNPVFIERFQALDEEKRVELLDTLYHTNEVMRYEALVSVAVDWPETELRRKLATGLTERWDGQFEDKVADWAQRERDPETLALLEETLRKMRGE